MSGTRPSAGRMLRPLPGGGLLARHGENILLCGTTPSSGGPGTAHRLRAAVDALEQGGDGPRFVRRIARLLGEENPPPLVALGPAGNAMALIVHGAARVALTMDDGELILDGRAAATYTDRMLPAFPVAVRAWLGPAGPGSPDPWVHLDGGRVRAGGLLLAAPPASPGPPAPPARPSAPAAALAGPPEVLGVHCKNDHFNEPGARFCAVCGISMVQLTLVARPGPRPPLGLLVLDDGATFRLDTDYVLGRAPERDHAVVAGTARSLRVADDAGGVSRVHAKVVLDGWAVRVIDLGSANGTYLQREGGPWERLPAHMPVSIRPGTNVAFGRRGVRYESHRGT